MKSKTVVVKGKKGTKKPVKVVKKELFVKKPSAKAMAYMNKVGMGK